MNELISGGKVFLAELDEPGRPEAVARFCDQIEHIAVERRGEIWYVCMRLQSSADRLASNGVRIARDNRWVVTVDELVSSDRAWKWISRAVNREQKASALNGKVQNGQCTLEQSMEGEYILKIEPKPQGLGGRGALKGFRKRA